MTEHSEKPVIAVLMSTYNGEKYLREQLDSIFGQTDVRPVLYVRDDASSDGTIALLKKYRSEKNAEIVIMEADQEGNVGVYASWDILLEQVPRDYEYYAISDQDDIWKPRKLSVGIAKLATFKDIPAIYNCGTTAVGEDGRVIKQYDFSRRRCTLQSVFVRYSIPAHSVVFNSELRSLLDLYSTVEVPACMSLEPRLFISCLACSGKWVCDAESFVRWRRTAESQTVQGSGLKKRLHTEWDRFVRTDIESARAKCALAALGDRVDIPSREFLELVVSARSDMKSKIELFLNKGFTSGVFALDLLSRMRLMVCRW